MLPAVIKGHWAEVVKKYKYLGTGFDDKLNKANIDIIEGMYFFRKHWTFHMDVFYLFYWICFKFFYYLLVWQFECKEQGKVE